VRELPITRAQALALAGVALALAVIVGRVVLPAGGAAGGAPQAELHASAAPRGSSPTAESTALVVHVVGAVRRPGLYRLPAGARVADAVERAGGAGVQADVALVNLAAPLADGQQVVVPARAEAGTTDGGGSAGSAASGPLHLNTATAADLDELPGVGPVTAQKIVEYREQHGAFSSVDDLDAIPGIGPARLEQLRGLVAP
jgi:competence protein ComEA